MIQGLSARRVVMLGLVVDKTGGAMPEFHPASSNKVHFSRLNILTVGLMLLYSMETCRQRKALEFDVVKV